LTKEIVGGYGTWMAKRDSKRLVALQDESGKTDNTSEAGSGELASTGSGDGLGLVVGGGDTTGGSRGSDRGGLVDRGRDLVSLLRAAVLVGLGLDGLLDGARAVGDGDDTGGGDGDGLVTVNDLGGSRAVGGVALDDLGDDNGTVLAVGGSARDGGEEGSGDRVLHLDGIRLFGLCCLTSGYD
jgi:hypothetical protein